MRGWYEMYEEERPLNVSNKDWTKNEKRLGNIIGVLEEYSGLTKFLCG